MSGYVLRHVFLCMPVELVQSIRESCARSAKRVRENRNTIDLRSRWGKEVLLLSFSSFL